MTRVELAVALDVLETHARAASLADSKTGYDLEAQQAVIVRKTINDSTVGQMIDLIEYTELAYTAARTGDDTELDAKRTELRNAPLRPGEPVRG